MRGATVAKPCTPVVPLPGSALLAVGTAAGLVVVIDVRDGATKAELTGTAGAVYDTFAAGGALWAAGDDALVRKYVLA